MGGRRKVESPRDLRTPQRGKIEQLLAEKTKEVANQAQEATTERGRLWAEVEKLKGELACKDEEFAEENEACKQDVAQAFLVGFEVTKLQDSTPTLITPNSARVKPWSMVN